MKKRTVLVVDDQFINRHILGKILSNEYDIIYAENGVQALDKLRKYPELISAVLLDIMMPVMDGYEVLRELSKDPVLSKIPVLVSSQKDGEEAEVQALSLGAQDFIAKPYKADIICHRLENTIRLRETAAMINKVERDEVTGLYSKQFFIDKVTEYLQQNPDQSFDLICVGIERFKLINETFGIRKGDEVLNYVAKIISGIEPDIGLCGRFSADEFYLLLSHRENYSTDTFSYWDQKLIKAPVDMDVRIHWGIYEISTNDLSVEEMCERARLATNQNKGKYDVKFSYYDESIRNEILEEQFIVTNMERALEQKQFHVYYQPKYDLRSEMIAGAEALVRWIHPEKGFMSPGAFIPIFERNGFVTKLDRYVWEKVCDDLHCWMELGNPPLAISINVSRADLYNPKLTDILLELVAKYKIPLHYLHLEITESAYTNNPQQIIAVVNHLRKLGFIIEMDDFGSGYSSLNMLAEMPVDVLKLDMRFIQNEAKKTAGKGILSFVISMAKWLNLAVVAEGVETGEQIATLRSMDCNYVQGFYYARPMARDDFWELLRTSPITDMVCTNKSIEQFVQQEEPERQRSVSNREMLIVDDIDVNRAVLAGTFMDEYKLVEKENGQEAWEYLQAHYQDVEIVMLDLLMPVMDGFQLLDKIRSEENTRDIPVIITSQGDAESEQRALQLKADDFIAKPYKPDIIRRRVHNALASYELKRVKDDKGVTGDINGVVSGEKAQEYMNTLKPHFDIVRLVDPRQTMVCESGGDCNLHSCFSVWGRHSRCNNCISLKSLEKQDRQSKLEYSEHGLYFVISEYVPYYDRGAVIEMVTRLEDEYVDNVFDKDMLYMKLDKIHQQLEYDELTGVYNRRHIDKYFGSYIENAARRGVNLGIAMADIDSFKQLNDKYGHVAGDEIIRQVAQLLKNNIAVSKGDFVARYGGDEFMIVCGNIASDVFVKRMQTITKLVEHISIHEGENGDIGLSAGCVTLEEYPNFTANDFIKCADKRLYAAKESGKGRVVYKEE
ncbi:MAG: EAL domain-containing protein [Hespellia sp.]|nr:EAL domain-containing protein [Hespellia sp.]